MLQNGKTDCGKVQRVDAFFRIRFRFCNGTIRPRQQGAAGRGESLWLKKERCIIMDGRAQCHRWNTITIDPFQSSQKGKKNRTAAHVPKNNPNESSLVTWLLDKETALSKKIFLMN